MVETGFDVRRVSGKETKQPFLGWNFATGAPYMQVNMGYACKNPDSEDCIKKTTGRKFDACDSDVAKRLPYHVSSTFAFDPECKSARFMISQ